MRCWTGAQPRDGGRTPSANRRGLRLSRWLAATSRLSYQVEPRLRVPNDSLHLAVTAEADAEDCRLQAAWVILEIVPGRHSCAADVR